MDKHYYIVSQMPELRFDTTSYMDTDKFLAEAAKWLSLREMWTLTNVHLFAMENMSVRSRVYRDVQRYEQALRQDVAAWRRARAAGGEYKPVVFTASVLKEGNPLDIEIKLLKLRWDYIDGLMTGHHFDMGFLILYSLKLQILGKLSEFDKEKGRERYRGSIAADLDEFLIRTPVEANAEQA